MMWRGKDAVYNILGHLVFVVPNELPIIAYRELLSRFCRQRGFSGHPLRISNIFKYWAYAARALAQ